jgi:hypothetical protein
LRVPPAEIAGDPRRRLMKIGWLAVAIAAVALVAADPALARKRHKPAPRPQCAAGPYQFTWEGLWFNGRPLPNGCSPAVHQFGEYIGQDPDPNIRFQLQRDPTTGYIGTLTK